MASPPPAGRRAGGPGRGALGLGIELAGALVGFALLGYWIDRHFATGPWGLLVCLLLGLVGGLYNFVRQSLQVLRESPTRTTRRRDDEESRE